MVEKKELKGLSKRNIFIAVIFSLLITGYLVYASFDYQTFLNIEWDTRALIFVSIAGFMMVGRHLAYMYRVWLVTGKIFSWRQSFESILMWEFASAATPSTVGGAAVAMFILNKENVPMGRSTASVMVITIMDNVFFVLAGTLAFLLLGATQMFALDSSCGDAMDLPLVRALGGLQYIFLVGISFSAILVILLIYGVFVNPGKVKQLLVWFGSTWLFRRWKSKAVRTGDEIITTAAELKLKSWRFWLRLFGATCVAWSFKYLVVNSILTAFGHLTGYDQLIVMSRVLALWIVMLIPFTPGASGLAELAFIALMCSFFTYLPEGEMLTQLTVLTLLWRLFTYYPYLVFGALLMPRWLRRVYRQ